MKNGFPWAALAAITGTVTMLCAGGLMGLLAYWQRDFMRLSMAALERTNEIAKHVGEMNAPPKWVERTGGTCYTNKTEVICTFTNLSDAPITTCARGKLVQKAPPSAKLESVVMCTGKLLPTETRTVVGPWLGGFADDICGKDTSWGRSLDWSKCVFDTEPVDVPRLRAEKER